MPRSSAAPVEIRGDFDDMGYALGIIKGTATAVKTNRYLGDVIEFVHGQLSTDFDQWMDAQYMVAHKRYHHVYDWGAQNQSDLTDLRLWGHKLIGNGGQRNATWFWKASKNPVPDPIERHANPDDPLSLVPIEELEKLSKRTYYFYWKAPVMEYNLPVNIEPKYATMLFIPTGDPNNPFVFSTGTRATNVGGGETTGAFTSAWVAYWGGPAQSTFSEKLEPILSNDITSVQAGIRTGKRVRSGTVGLTTTTSFNAAMDAGERWAEQHIYKKGTSYKRRAGLRRR